MDTRENYTTPVPFEAKESYQSPLKQDGKVERVDGIFYTYLQCPEIQKYHLSGATDSHFKCFLEDKGFRPLGKWLYKLEIGQKTVICCSPNFCYVVMGAGKQTYIPQKKDTDAIIREASEADLLIVIIRYEAGHFRNVIGRSRKYNIEDFICSSNSNFPNHCGVLLVAKGGGLYVDLLNNEENCPVNKKLTTGKTEFKRTEWTCMFRNYAKRQLIERGLLPKSLQVEITRASFSLCEPNACGLFVLTTLHMVLESHLFCYKKLQKFRLVDDWSRFSFSAGMVLKKMAQQTDNPFFKKLPKVSFEGMLINFETLEVEGTSSVDFDIVKCLTCKVRVRKLHDFKEIHVLNSNAEARNDSSVCQAELIVNRETGDDSLEVPRTQNYVVATTGPSGAATQPPPIADIVYTATDASDESLPVGQPHTISTATDVSGVETTQQQETADIVNTALEAANDSLPLGQPHVMSTENDDVSEYSLVHAQPNISVNATAAEPCGETPLSSALGNLNSALSKGKNKRGQGNSRGALRTGNPSNCAAKRPRRK